MTRGTTPTLIFDFCDCCLDFRLLKSVEVTFSQDEKMVFSRNVDIDKEVKDNTFFLTLTKEETELLKADKYVRYQAFLNMNGVQMTTPIYKEMVLPMLGDE